MNWRYDCTHIIVRNGTYLCLCIPECVHVTTIYDKYIYNRRSIWLTKTTQTRLNKPLEAYTDLSEVDEAHDKIKEMEALTKELKVTTSCKPKKDLVLVHLEMKMTLMKKQL